MLTIDAFFLLSENTISSVVFQNVAAPRILRFLFLALLSLDMLDFLS